jgi:diguanylate cyclase
MDGNEHEARERFAKTVDLEESEESERIRGADEALVLVLIAHPHQRSLGRRHHLKKGSATQIGRSPECEIDFPDVPLLSRAHARIGWDDSGVWVEDLDSTNGTFVNQVRIEGRVVLDSGDRIQCGGVHFKFLRELDVEAAYYETLHQLALQDALTEIANKRLFDEELDREFSRARRHDRRLSLILFDVDDFKHINDVHGHLSGDLVLQHIARIGRREMRREELFGRLGGDEFGVLSPEVEADGARVLAERLRTVIADSPLTTESVEAARKSPTFSDVGQRPPETIAAAITRGPLNVTCSFGVAELEPDMENIEAFYAAADEALYASKNGGRNRVTVFGNQPYSAD